MVNRAGIDDFSEGFLPRRTMLQALTVNTFAAGHTIEALDEGPFTEALVCLRPEDMSLAPAGEHAPGSARNRIPGRVSRIVRTGADARVEIDCGFRLTARVTRRSL